MPAVRTFLVVTYALHEHGIRALLRDGFVAELALGWNSTGQHVITMAGGAAHLSTATLHAHAPAGVQVYDGPLGQHTDEMREAFHGCGTVAVTHISGEPGADGPWVRTIAAWPALDISRTLLTLTAAESSTHGLEACAPVSPAAWLAI